MMNKLKAKLRYLGGFTDINLSLTDIKDGDVCNIHSKKYNHWLELFVIEDKFIIYYGGELFTFNCQKEGLTKLIHVLAVLEVDTTDFDVNTIHSLLEEVENMEDTDINKKYKEVVKELQKDLIKRVGLD